jgi:hypothetical protein
VVLLPGLDLVKAGEGLHQQGCAELREPLAQADGILAVPDLRPARREDRAVVELLVHLHDRHPGAPVPSQDGMRDRRRAPPAR